MQCSTLSSLVPVLQENRRTRSQVLLTRFEAKETRSDSKIRTRWRRWWWLISTWSSTTVPRRLRGSYWRSWTWWEGCNMKPVCDFCEWINEYNYYYYYYCVWQVFNMFHHRSLGIRMNIRVTKLVLLHSRPVSQAIIIIIIKDFLKNL